MDASEEDSAPRTHQAQAASPVLKFIRCLLAIMLVAGKEQRDHIPTLPSQVIHLRPAHTYNAFQEQTTTIQ